MVAYWDAAPEDDAFFMALKKGSTLNKRAARWAAASAILTGVAAMLPVAWQLALKVAGLQQFLPLAR
jgi:hypothetical protein